MRYKPVPKDFKNFKDACSKEYLKFHTFFTFFRNSLMKSISFNIKSDKT